MASKKSAARTADAIEDRFVRSVCARLSANKAVRRSLPVWGRVHIDRQLPFVCVYRRPAARDDAGTERLVTSEASYLTASGASRLEAGLKELVRSVSRTLAECFGAFLILEVWSGRKADTDSSAPPEPAGPRFRLVVPEESDLGAALESFEGNLRQVKVAGRRSEVIVSRSSRWAPGRFAPLVSAKEARALNCSVAGLEVGPIYRDPDSGDLFPLVLRQLRRGLTRALRRTFYDFVRSRTVHLPEHYHVLGRRAIVKAVWEVDQRLAQVSDRFDLLLQLTPTNVESAWRAFERGRFQKPPVFRYRPVPVDPVLLKRRLYSAPLERIEDPALAEIFREKQDELDRRLTMLVDINTKRFLHGSIQVFDGVDRGLLRSARQILERVPPRARDNSSGGYLGAEEFARLAREEIEHYRKQWPGLEARVQVRTDVLSGLMVSHGSLLIGHKTRIPASRAEALLHHEVGTHVLTYHNGRAQGLRQLYSGFAGYEALQEGIAVLAEYLVGGLSRTRLRLLAGRVVAVRHLIDGASFVDTFRALREDHGFSAAGAYSIAMRVYRGGGLTKDAVYLKGLGHLLDYLGDGGGLDPLFVGKIAVKHVPIVRELRLRGVLNEPPLRPRYLDRPDAASRLEQLRRGATALDLIEDRRGLRVAVP